MTINTQDYLQAVEKRDYYPATLQQEGVWFQSLLMENKAGWNSFHGWSCRGLLRPEAFEKAVRAVMARHASLRSSFLMLDRQLAQRIHPHFPLEDYYCYEDLSEAADPETAAFKAGARDAGRPFDLEKGPLARFFLFRLGEERHLIIINKHHIVFDVASRQRLWRDLISLYRDFAAGREPELEPLELQYHDYAYWQRRYLIPSSRYQEQKWEWLERLQSPLPVFAPPAVSRPSKSEDSPPSGVRLDVLDRQTTARLRAMALRRRVSLGSVFLSAFSLLLFAYGREEELMVGTVFRGRNAHKAHLDKLVGLLANRLALRIEALEPRETVASFMTVVHREMAAAYKRQEVVFEDLLRALEPAAGGDAAPVFQVTFNMLSVPRLSQPKDGEVVFHRKWDNSGRDTPVAARYPMSLFIRDDMEEIETLFLYSSTFWTEMDAERMSGCYRFLLDSISRDPDMTLREVELADDAQKREILEVFNDTDQSGHGPRTIIALFEQQAENHPHRTALVMGSERLTFRQLDRWAGGVAARLQANGIGLDTLVPLLCDRSFAMVAGMLGILKAGGAYVPLDPQAPAQRLNRMLRDLAAPLQLTRQMVEEWRDVPPPRQGPASAEPRALAYIIYTSGSTGVPKGVGVEHAAIVNTLRWRSEFYGFSPRDMALQFPNYTFDSSVVDIFNPLTGGFGLILAPDHALKNLGRLIALMERECATNILLVPNFYNAFLQELDRPLPAMRVVTLGGERVPPELPALHNHKLPRAALVNEYGPTENSVCSTATVLDPAAGIIHIGTPIANCRCLILDRHDKLCPVGVPGHLHLGGAGLARCYVNNPLMTAERFFSSPFHPGERLYRSGDLARWLSDGSIDFLGRVDNQVKIRGFRIELGEIESQMARLDGVEEAACRVDTDETGQPFLVAFYTGTATDLHSRLTDRLPDYMIPSAIHNIPDMPRTAGHKIDRRKLPRLRHPGSREPYAEPANQMEQTVAAVWETVLGRSPISVNQNFFSLGGDSIKAMQMIARLQAQGLLVELAQVFSHPTIRRLAPHVSSLQRRIPQEEFSGSLPLIPIQQWFLRKNLTHPHHFNMARIFNLPDRIPVDHARQGVDILMRRHDMLRARLSPDHLSLQISPAKNMTVPFEVHDIPAGAVEVEFKRVAQVRQESFDLYTGPLVRFILFKTPDRDIFLFIAHHLIMDGVSLRILEDDLQTVLERLQTGDPVRLAPKTHAFAHWAGYLSQLSNDPRFREQTDYWLRMEEAVAQHPLPGGDSKTEHRPSTQEEYLSVHMELDQTLTRHLLEDVHHAYTTTINDLLLSGLGMAVCRVWGLRRVAVNLESHGRHPLDSAIDITRTVGWFTCQYPLVLDIDPGAAGTTVRRVKESLRRVPDHGIGYGLLSRSETEPDLSFNYMGHWSPPTLDVGPTRSPQAQQLFPLTLNGGVANGSLRFTIKGDRRRFNRRDMESLSSNLRDCLQEIILHCRHQSHTIPTPSDFSAVHLTEEELAAITALNPQRDIEDILDLSPMQAGMLFYHQLEPQSTAYAVQAVYDLEGEVDPELFQEALRRLALRHQVFRLAVTSGHGPVPRQVVFNQPRLDFLFLDVSGESDPMNTLDQIKEQQLIHGFDLEQGGAIRHRLIKTAQRRFHWLVSNHHIILDGWSSPLWLGDFLSLYRQLKQGAEPRLPEPVPLFSDYIRWLYRQDHEAATDFWARYLDGLASPPRLEEGATQPLPENCVRSRRSFQLPDSLAAALSRAANDAQATLSNLLQAAWAVLLHRHTRSDDVVFGTVISGRHAPIDGVERMVGLLIGTVPVRVRLDCDQNMAGLAAAIRDIMAQCQQHSYIPLTEAALAAEVNGPLFEHLFVYESFPSRPEQQDEQFAAEAGFKISGRQASEQTHYLLNLLVMPREELTLRFQYNGSAYSESFIAQLERHMLTLLESVARDPGQQLRELDMAPAQERQTIMRVFNETERDFPSGTTIHDWFLRQALATPDALAIRDQVQSVTYGQLARSAAALSSRLLEHGLAQESIVPVMGERSLSVMTAIYAVLLAGGAYLPVDPHYPRERIVYILKDCGAKLMLLCGDAGGGEQLRRQWRGSVLNVDGLIGPSDDKPRLPVSTVNHRSPAYLIYTSGSTGRPKGALLEHRPLCNRLHWMQSQYPIGPGDFLLHKTPFTFDVSVWEIFWWSLYGAAVTLLPPGGERDPGVIAEALECEPVAVVHFVPSMMKAFLDYLETGARTFPYLRWVVASGEALTAAAHQRFNRLLGPQGARLANLYGPTEACIDVSYFNCPQNGNMMRIPIGKPIHNTKLVVVGPGGRLQPIGVAGELWISGAGLARGYLNQPELTARAFVRSDLEGISRWYRSGDLARVLPDGNIEYLGRLDHQVKIRGFRIELGEIEALLLSDPAVRDAAVAAWGAGEDCRLAAYVVPAESTEDLAVESIRSRLTLHVPDYMVPAVFMALPELPLNANGKLDRKRLPEPGAAFGLRPPLRLPRDEVEQELARLWRQILKIEEVGLDDHFFNLGGHSLRAMNVVGGIRQQFQVELPVKTVFDYPLLADLSLVVKRKVAERDELLRLLSEVETMENP